MSAPPVEGRLTQSETTPDALTIEILSFFCWVIRMPPCVKAMPTGWLTPANGTAPVTWSRELWNAIVLLSGDQLGWLSWLLVVSGFRLMPVCWMDQMFVFPLASVRSKAIVMPPGDHCGLASFTVVSGVRSTMPVPVGLTV